MIVRLRGVDINYESHRLDRDATALVLIHGFGASLRTWDRVSPALGAHRPWLAVDLKGFGLSGHPRDGKYSLDENAELVVALINHVGLGRVVLIGHSYGGAVTIATAIKLRDRGGVRTDGLVLIDAASYEQRLPFFVEVLRHRITRFLSGMTSVERSTRTVLRALFVDKSLIDDAMVERYAFPRRIAGSDYASTQTAQQILPQSFEAVTTAIRSIDVPTLIIWGDRDNAVPVAFADRLHHDIAGSRKHIVRGVGHMPHEERPEEVLRVMEAFFAELPA